MTWDKTKPDGGAPLNQGDDEIRNNFDHLEDALSREHEFPNTYLTTSGMHSFPFAATKALMEGRPNYTDFQILFRTDLGGFQLFTCVGGTWYPVGGPVAHVTAATRLALSSANLYNGFLVVESDTDNLWRYDTDWDLLYPSLHGNYGKRVAASTQGQILPLFSESADLILGLSTFVGVPADVTHTGDAGIDYETNVHARMPVYCTSAAKLWFELQEKFGTGAWSTVDEQYFKVNNAQVHTNINLFYKNSTSWGDLPFDETIYYRVIGRGEGGSNYIINYNVEGNTFYGSMMVDLRQVRA